MTLLIILGTIVLLFPQHRNVICEESTSMYPTGFTPSSIRWQDNTHLLIMKSDTVLIHDTENRTYTTLITQRGRIILDAMIAEDSLRILSRDDLSQYYSIIDTNEHVPTSTTSYPSNLHITLGNNNLCITQIKEIQTPQDIATEIKIYDEAGKKVQHTMKTPLTLIPDSCDDPLILFPPSPLEHIQYTWYFDSDSPEKNPQKTRTYNLETPYKEDFIATIPNENETSFVLISTEGSLWLLTREKEPCLHPGNLFLKFIDRFKELRVRFLQ